MNSVIGPFIRFQSTLPARGATVKAQAVHLVILFQSTLPARGATVLPPPGMPPFWYFNPRSPREERQTGPISSPPNSIFQSTLPARGATAKANKS